MAMNSVKLSSKSARGMTLIEVMVALFIVAIALSAVIRNMNSGISNADYLKQKTFAHWVAMNEVAEQQTKQFSGAKNVWTEAELAERVWHINTKVIVVKGQSLLRIETKVYRQRDDESYLASAVNFVAATQ